MSDYDYEKLGQFYLGKEYDQDAKKRLDNLLLYDSRDLCTHAVVVGMTGSGKTGLCVDLLEEAAMDRIPSIVIDPKGDISNLLLTFPNLTPEEFRPWVDEGQAARKGISPEEHATNEANKWKEGLAGWHQTAERIRTLRETVDMRIYTPGSNTGRPLTILKSFSAPPQAVLNDSDALHDRISSATSGLLALMGIEADPINSQEHIMISKILEHNWRKGIGLDLGKLIGQIQNPPFERVGIMELDDFYSKKDRQSLAMTMNNLLASPSFSSWLQGEPLDIKRMLHTPEGKPCISIISIAHLSDSERMFFVTIVLNEMLSWMRTQAGTSSLRALLYMDEVFGYFPPTKNPPSKQPMLTLLKQARAFGLGCVLATQNPVDLDYKGLSNAGTWFLGRLQTERDKARVLEGLEGASAQAGSQFDRGAMERTLAGLGSRVFLMNNVHDNEPVVFETRWAMSYLRGPLTRNQIQKLVQEDPNYDREKVLAASAARRPSPEKAEEVETSVDPRQLIPDSVTQYFVEPNERVSRGDRLIYRPSLYARGRLHFVKSTYKIDEWVEMSLLSKLSGGEMPDEVWEEAELLEDELDMSRRPDEDGKFGKTISEYQKSKNYTSWKKELKEYFYRGQSMTVWKCEDLKKYSEANEELGDFKVRLEQFASELRDDEVEKLRKRYSKKFQTLRSQIRRAEDKIEVEEAQYKQSRMSSVLSVGTTLMGALLGRRSTRNASSSMTKFGRASKEKGDIARAKDGLEELQIKFEDMESEFNEAVQELEDKLDVSNLEFSELKVTPRKSDISVEEFGLCWLPWRIDSDGVAEAIY
ncbi:MAG: DUF87 domain-containing protein [Mariniblastus sp.]